MTIDGPSSPTTPGGRRTGPTTPGSRSGPTTPGAGAIGPVAAGPFTPRGTPMVFARSDASRELLKIEWDYPVPADGAQAMAFASTLAKIRGDDPRPLLILRECEVCDVADFALLSRSGQNEETRVLTRWFHCVKVAGDVRDPAHPFHGLFGTKNPPHVMVCDRDGEDVFVFDGSQQSSKVHRAMYEILREAYRHDAKLAVKRVRRLLEEFDRVDTRLLELRERLDRELERGGPKSARYRQLSAKRDALRADKAKLDRKLELVTELGLKSAI